MGIRMVEPPNLGLSILSAVIGISAAIIMTFVCTRRKDLKFWLLAYYAVAAGLLASAIGTVINPGADNVLSNVFYSLAIVIIFIAIVKEYRETFMKNELDKNKFKKALPATFVVNPVILGLEIFIITFCIIGAVLLIRIYLHKRTPTHAFLILILLSAFSTLMVTIIRTLGVEGIRVFGQGITIFF